jgi:hypothetical protein
MSLKLPVGKEKSIGCRPGGGFLRDKQRQKRMAETNYLSSCDKKVKNIKSRLHAGVLVT